MAQLRILLVASDSDLGASIRRKLETLRMDPVAVAHDGEAGLALAEELQPDVACVSVPLQGSLDAAETAVAIRTRSGVPVVFCAASCDGGAIGAARRAGVRGYVVEGSPLEQYRAVLELALPMTAAERQTHVDYGLVSHTGRSGTYPLATQAEPASGRQRDPAEDLSVREYEVFELLSRGTRVAEVAGTLYISPHTVRKHAKSIFRKLRVHSQVELMRSYAHRDRRRTPQPR